MPQLAEGGGAHSARRPQGEIVEMVDMPGEARLMDERAGNLRSQTPETGPNDGGLIPYIQT